MEDLTKISEAMEEYETKMDILGNLPIEIFFEILLYLSPRDLQSVRCVCDLWRNNMEPFWKIKCKMENYFECEDDLNSEFYRNFVQGFSHWEGIYMYNSKLRENWVNLKFKEISVRDHQDIRKIHHFCGDFIIVSTKWNEILVINSTTGAVENRFLLTDYAAFINAIENMDNRLMVVLTKMIGDGNPNYHPTVMYLKIWNLETGGLLTESEKEIPASVQKVIIHKNLITVITDPYAVYIYNIVNQNVDYDQDCVTSVCHYNDKIVLGNHAGKILIMDMDYIEVMTLNCCSDDRIISNIQMDGNYLVCICQKRSKNHVQACIWNVKTKTKLYEIPHVRKDDLKMLVKENKLCYLFTIFDKGTFKLCHLDTGDCILEIEDKCISINDFLIIQRNCGNQFLLKMWSIKTGELVTNLDLVSPYKCFNVFIKRSTTKSKIAYFEYDYTRKGRNAAGPFGTLPTRCFPTAFPQTVEPDKVTLKIVDFQALIEI